MSRRDQLLCFEAAFNEIMRLATIESECQRAGDPALIKMAARSGRGKKRGDVSSAMMGGRTLWRWQSMY